MHKGTVKGTSEINPNPAVADKVLYDITQNFALQTREALEDTLKFIQYSLNGRILIYDMASGLAQPTVLEK